MTIQLAASRDEYDKSPASFEGFIEKRLKRRIDMTIDGKLFAMNTHGIVTRRTILEDGRTWYSYTSSSDFHMESLREEMDWVASHAIGKDHIGLIYK
ncbi:hypothetical protein ACKU3Z_029845 [Pseudomonas aeruginosa]|nr:hypothetical protein [Pseudomonas aeruginosa]